MTRTCQRMALLLVSAVFLLAYLCCNSPVVNATEITTPGSLSGEEIPQEGPIIEDTTAEDPNPEGSEPEIPDLEDPEDPDVPEDPENPENPENPEEPEEPAPKQGLVEENGNLYFYNEDGSLFTDGYKVVTTEEGKQTYYFFQEDGSAFTGGYKVLTAEDGKRTYYYFQEDGTAFTDGYLNFTVADKEYYFFFQEDGTAFTGGYKEVIIDGQVRYFYFLGNGQGFNTGYKTVMIDGTKYYFYFGSNGQAKTDLLQKIPLGDRNAYMLFGTDGKAFTNGYKELVNASGTTNYYYFLGNGQAFTTGYKTVKINDVTYYYFFQSNGKAFTGGLKKIAFGNLTFPYYFGKDGKAVTSDWATHGNAKYYFQANGRAVLNLFMTIDGNLYHFNKAGKVSTGGWFCVGDGYYYADEQGVLSTNTIVDNYKLDANGKSRTKYRILEYVNKYTDESMTDQEKIDALYNWVWKNSMTYISSYEHVSSSWTWPDGFVDDFATSVMDKWGGNCFKFSSFLGLMVREATGLPVTIYHGNMPLGDPHGWITVTQDGKEYLYDVQQAKRGRNQSQIYKVPYPGSRLHCNGIGVSLS